MLREGDVVRYHNRHGIVIEAFERISGLAGPMVKVYFFDANKDVILDMSVLNAYGERLEGGIDEVEHMLCDCGEKHTEKPHEHSYWCKLTKLRKGNYSAILESSSKLVD